MIVASNDEARIQEVHLSSSIGTAIIWKRRSRPLNRSGASVAQRGIFSPSMAIPKQHPISTVT
jgi:hypothetical protein